MAERLPITQGGQSGKKSDRPLIKSPKCVERGKLGGAISQSGQKGSELFSVDYNHLLTNRLFHNYEELGKKSQLKKNGKQYKVDINTSDMLNDIENKISSQFESIQNEFKES